ncbi:hypothetical protein [Cellulomonas phragmiteti]|uniref:hypothetical protein n=1 Tax=Cellulomonas phragmiteti TaxID=478780 RepID=UPI0019451A3D|nr:hypothetical protein [Cellulomonas phragmiteti]
MSATTIVRTPQRAFPLAPVETMIRVLSLRERTTPQADACVRALDHGRGHPPDVLLLVPEPHPAARVRSSTPPTVGASRHFFLTIVIAVSASMMARTASPSTGTRNVGWIAASETSSDGPIVHPERVSAV